MVAYICQRYSPNSSPRPFPPCPQVCSLHLCLYFSLANRFISRIFPDPIHMQYWVLIYGICFPLSDLLFSCSHVQLFCKPMDCSPPGSSVHEISQARTLEWVAIPFSRGSSQRRNQTSVSCTAGGFSTAEPPGKPSFLTYFSLYF